MASSNNEEIPFEENNEDEDIPNVQRCQELVENFVAVTSTNEALAQFFLQDHKWDLQQSLNAFYESLSSEIGNHGICSRSNDPELILTFDSAASTSTSEGPGIQYEAEISTKPPTVFSVVSWNLDGLDDHNLKKRTKAVVKIIEMERPDIVFLQEVIPITFSYLEEHLPQYMFISGGASDYFNATLLFRNTVYFDGHSLHSFPNSRMGRHLIYVNCHIGSLKLRLLNSHLESTREFSGERKNQLKFALQLMEKSDSKHTTIFGGDLNLRDKEADEVQIPFRIQDLWERCGKRQECKFTWDTFRNTNKPMSGRFKPRFRFDRMYLLNGDPISVKAKHFGLVGIQKVSGTQSFPSDHWGIVAHFDILNQNASTSSPSPSHNAVTTNTSDWLVSVKDTRKDSAEELPHPKDSAEELPHPKDSAEQLPHPLPDFSNHEMNDSVVVIEPIKDNGGIKKRKFSLIDIE